MSSDVLTALLKSLVAAVAGSEYWVTLSEALGAGKIKEETKQNKGTKPAALEKSRTFETILNSKVSQHRHKIQWASSNHSYNPVFQKPTTRQWRRGWRSEWWSGLGRQDNLGLVRLRAEVFNGLLCVCVSMCLSEVWWETEVGSSKVGGAGNGGKSGEQKDEGSSA